MNTIHWKTKVALDLLLNGEGWSGSGNGDRYTYYIPGPDNDHESRTPIITIPAEAQQLLDMAAVLVIKANIAIEQDRNLTY